MPILHQTKNFEVEPFADGSGTFFIILRKKRNIFGQRPVVAKIRMENQAKAVSQIKNRLKELELATAITEERIRKTQSAVRKGIRFSKETIKEFNKLTKTPTKRRKTKTKKKRR